jgi:CubicO group peptidase (beta-lactamase class C family)
MKVYGIFVCACLFFGAAVTSVAQTAADASASKSADEFVTHELGAQKIPGISLAVMRDGKIIKAQGYGLANVELNVAVKPETIFQTGSVGKQFTAALIMMLVEEEKLGLDDKISKYFPEAPATWKEITVRNLLTHTSGIPDYTGEGNAANQVKIDLRRDYTENELVAEFEKAPLDFQPGEKWSYSNSGYVTLGVLIHKITGKFYGDMLKERIFDPLGMKSTRIISEEDIVPNRAAGYRLEKGVLKNQKWVAPMLNTTADGALYTNVLDLEKWDAALYSEAILKRSSLAQIWTPVKLKSGATYGYGFGWDVHKVNDHWAVEHGGSWQGFTMQISRYVNDRVTVVVFTNLDSDDANPEKIARGVAAIYIPGVKAEEEKK